MNRLFRIGFILPAIVFIACASTDGDKDITSGDVVRDTAYPDACDEGSFVQTDVFAGADLASQETVETEDRYFTFRTIGGLSMGAAALTVAAHYPEMFDGVAALGGYVDSRYMAHLIRDLIGGGFCPMQDILKVVFDDSVNGTDEINNPDNPLVDCSLKPDERKLRHHEVYMTYNKLVFAEQGLTTFDRVFLLDVLEALVYAYGNVMFFNPEHPLAPPGVDLSWVRQTDAEKCANPAHVGFPHNLNAEYNPDGEYDLITFCDGNPDVCRGIEDCDEGAPEFRARRGWFFPDQRDLHIKPVVALLAVDYNRNGLRDYGEPVVFNMGERWDDFGVDGCTDEYEDGHGGCQETASGQVDLDPNGDNFDLMNNPAGPEGNAEYDDGERFYDWGVDGVDSGALADLHGLDAELVADLGEGDGKYTPNPRWAAVVDTDARSFFMNSSEDVLRRHSFFFDGGIRDGLGALCPAYHLAKNLELRGIPVRYYQDFVGRPDSVFPNMGCEDLIGTTNDFGTLDFSSESAGRNFLIAYGDPDIDEETAYKNGSGNHIGNGCELNLRVAVPFVASNFRMPNPIISANFNFSGTMSYESYYSDVLKSRRWFVVNLPPDYDSQDCVLGCDAESGDERLSFNELEYPVSYLLPGIGMPLNAMSVVTLLLNLTMGYGSSPRYVLIVPDGQCCYRHKETGEQVCNCFVDGNRVRCVDRECRGDHSECSVTVTDIDDFLANHEQECNSGHFFVNQATNRYGLQGDGLAALRFEDALIELIQHVEDTWRIRKPATVSVPAGY